MSKSAGYAEALLDLVFLNKGIPGIGDGAGIPGSVAAGDFFVSLHTADPGAGGSQLANEAKYAGYQRVARARGATGWSRTGNKIQPSGNIDFPECVGAPGAPMRYFAIGKAASGGGLILYRGILGNPIVVAVGTIPRLKPDTEITED